MYNYMEYLTKCFNQTTEWNEDNLYSNILATSSALLDFPVPSGGKVEVSSQATSKSASSMTLSNHHSINGSLAYLYSSERLTSVMGTKNISLQDAIAGFRIIEPHVASPKWPIKSESARQASLIYGRMYFPGTALEAMVIKRLTARCRVLVKSISNPHISGNGTMIMYLQENTPKFSREYIYSTNESLMGFRCLYNFGYPAKVQNIATLPKFDNSVVSVGAEVWYAASTMSPGLSTALRYSTRSTSTGKPLTMTLSCNPILGHVSSTYSVKTSVSSTVCSKYDFNWFSYASNLSIGFELFNFPKKPMVFKNSKIPHSASIHHDSFAPTNGNEERSDGRSITSKSSRNHRNKIYKPIEQSGDQHFSKQTLFRPIVSVESDGQEIISAFQKLVNKSHFSSAVKCSTSFRDKMLKLLWVGRYKDFLICTGVQVGYNDALKRPGVGQFGITFGYAC